MTNEREQGKKVVAHIGAQHIKIVHLDIQIYLE